MLLVSGTCVLALVTQGVLQIDPWYSADKVIPLAGMIFSGGMNAVSLSLERFYSELEQGNDKGRDGHLDDNSCSGEELVRCRQTAFHAALIPTTNSLLAVGLVSIPGMMTGQVLAGESPLQAARYQIVVMCMLYGIVGLASAGALLIAEHQLKRRRQETASCSEEKVES